MKSTTLELLYLKGKEKEIVSELEQRKKDRIFLLRIVKY